MSLGTRTASFGADAPEISIALTGLSIGLRTAAGGMDATATAMPTTDATEMGIRSG